jgi:hypothetical protein
MTVGGQLKYIPTASAQTVEASDLPAMRATLCSYENWFGPYHPNTLRMLVEAGVAHAEHGELGTARRLFEHAIRDLGRTLGWEHDLRLRAMGALREVCARQGDGLGRRKRRESCWSAKRAGSGAIIRRRCERGLSLAVY